MVLLYKRDLKSSLYGSLVFVMMAVNVEGGDTVVVEAEDEVNKGGKIER